MPAKKHAADKTAQKGLLGALANKSRLNILFALLEGEKNVSELAELFGLAQPLVSHNVKRLADAGFITSRRQGHFRYYSLNKDFSAPFLQAIDPTLRKGGKEKLRFRAILTQSPVVVLAYDTQGVITFVSGDTASNFGHAPPSLLGKSVFRSFPGREIALGLRQALRGKTAYWTSKLRKSTFDFTCVPYKDARKRVIGGIVVSHDVSRRAEAETVLNRSVLEWRSLAEGSPDLIARIDRDGVFMIVNRDIAGHSREQVIGTVLYDYLPEAIRREAGTKLRRIFRLGGEASFLTKGMGKADMQGLFECRIMPLKRKGRTIAVTFTARAVVRKAGSRA
ncbi:MAG TPA: metalloregulator ArsR/SmtB family transcription factor [Candidatus Baltobacteraceae bacterium]|nr:metalloregulator ArsR/SmtB family transcription factor [Candidatus Baltobacteraceae bacterium]